MAATRKRRRSAKRRTVRASNPKRRKLTTTRRRRRTGLSLLSRRRSNPVARRRGRRTHHRRRRNPISSGVIGEGLRLGLAGMAIGVAQKFVRPIVGSFLPAGPIANAGVTLGTAYGLGWVAGFIPVNAVRNMKRPLELAGWTLAATQLVTSYVLPALSSVTGGGGMSGWSNRMRGMRGIGAVTDIPPRIMAPAQVATGPQSAQGMKGVAALPGSRSRW